ncbi:tumor necrosis factor receptor superfamily member 1A-like isoform X1 [Numida meleagris]|uniref:tumor necrosis factor receptor superfamily member 1A-like isoform X1 n=2 Tax=Numida meleagris TaxID=8996 RepID=UPI000B3E35B7|nr:tumor necrosis factor receptor superfamily member 1A-like isoform X1 [Numida meleagris]
MRGPALPRSSLGTVILTFVCVLMEESVGIAPVPYMLQLHRVTLDGRDPFKFLRREKRQVQCPVGKYPHPKGTHCCMRCHAGTYKSKDCEWPDQAPVCLPCPNGTFTAVDNTMDKCFQCTRCRTELQQITETPCTLKQDTVCGCRKNQYQTGEADFFQCKNCSPCVNGIIANCSKDRDTICRCKPMFFRTLDNVCKHCNSCAGEECLLCSSPVTTSRNSSELNGNLVLGIIVAIFVVICVLYIVNKAVKLVQKNGVPSSLYSCVSLPQTSKEPVSEVEVKGSAITVLPVVQKETELPVNATPPAVPLLQSSHELPDCVRPARKRQLPDNPAILYTVVDHVPPSRWKEFVRRLGLTDYDLERIEMEHRRLRDAQYEMVRLWKLQMGHAATVEHISCVLNQMELSGCSEAIQEALLNQNSHQPCSFHSHLSPCSY